MAVDEQWALVQLKRFVAWSEYVPRTVNGARDFQTVANHDQLIAEAPVVELILDRVTPGWRPTAAEMYRWRQHRDAAQRAITLLQRQAELRDKLGDNAPTLDANRLHPWSWEGARSLWQSQHYLEAVEAALKKVNAEAQNKTGRFDIAETDLFKQLFTPDPPRSGRPRLRLMADDGSRTYDSVHRGAFCLAEGLYAGIRNLSAHTVTQTRTDEQRALEQLAAVSVLARWVDDAEVVTES